MKRQGYVLILWFSAWLVGKNDNHQWLSSIDHQTIKSNPLDTDTSTKQAIIDKV